MTPQQLTRFPDEFSDESAGSATPRVSTPPLETHPLAYEYSDHTFASLPNRKRHAGPATRSQTIQPIIRKEFVLPTPVKEKAKTFEFFDELEPEEGTITQTDLQAASPFGINILQNIFIPQNNTHHLK